MATMDRSFLGEMNSKTQVLKYPSDEKTLLFLL